MFGKRYFILPGRNVLDFVASLFIVCVWPLFFCPFSSIPESIFGPFPLVASREIEFALKVFLLPTIYGDVCMSLTSPKKQFALLHNPVYEIYLLLSAVLGF